MKIISLLQGAMSGARRYRTIRILILLGTCLTGFLQAQAPPPEPPQVRAQSAPQQLSPEELNRLLAPIALYPDALVALILPASTVPSEVVLAARYLASNGDPAQVANQPWDDSVKSLARYPDVLEWMDHNLEWTTTVGEAFLDQPADVMNSIQRLRAEAMAAGNLTNSPQQQIVQEETVIRIVPAQPDVIYVPQYDPEVVYMQPYSQDFGPLLTFGVGFAVGSWLNYDCDWGRRSIYVGQWRPGWNHDRNWDRGDRGRNWDRGDRGQNNNVVNVININSDTARQWQPSANSQRRQAHHQRNNSATARSASPNALDANDRPDAPSTSGMNGRSDPRASQIPKPSRADFTNQGDKRVRRDVKDSNESLKTSPGLPPSPDLAPNASGVPGDTPGARGKSQRVTASTAPADGHGEAGKRMQDDSHGTDSQELSRREKSSHQKVAAGTAPSATADVPRQWEKPLQSDGEQNTSRNRNKNAQRNHQTNGGANNQPTAAPSVKQPDASQERQTHVDHSQSAAPKAKNSSQSSNGQKHRKERASQSAPSLTKQDTPSQPPPKAAHREQTSQRSMPAAQQENASQPSKASQGKGKGDGKKKSDKKEDKGDD